MVDVTEHAEGSSVDGSGASAAGAAGNSSAAAAEVESTTASAVPPGVEGDLAALAGGAAMAVFLVLGGKLRRRLPTFLFFFPVNVAGAIVTACLSTWTEPVTWTGQGDSGVLGAWMVSSNDDWRRFWLACSLGLVPGLLGHGLAVLCLGYLPSLVVSLALLLEPLVGSLISWFFGLQDAPGALTFVGAVVLLAGAGMVIATPEQQAEPASEAPNGTVAEESASDDSGLSSAAAVATTAELQAPQTSASPPS